MTNEFRITKTGLYRTRDGRKSKVLEIDAPSDIYPIIGYIIDSDTSVMPMEWGVDGVYMPTEITDEDIISEWVEPDIIEEWHGVWLKKSLSYTGFTPEKIGFTITPYSNAVGVFEDDDISSLAVKFRLTTQPDGKQHLEILEQKNRGDV